ncbi:hypothetical protein E3T54_13655 [Cryobacterium sp. Sr8]|uniref:hypothetical protein n=1 Tax=Cryobacterium sp. Sr8 TaxID=1259203 RepID=UPI00106A4A6C|nr:hypothetical protein [Cryobacterium sp. Sr8]TFD74615.1 hypothetical protein E3T54_13655 [Cryobacterium sp. Sr8]
MPDSSFDAFARSLAKLYVKGRRATVTGYRALRPLALAIRPMPQKVYLAVFGSRKRKIWAGAVALLLVLGTVGTSVGVSYANELERVAAVAAKDAAVAAKDAADAKAAVTAARDKVADDKLKDELARSNAEATVSSSEAFATASADYVTPEDSVALASGIDTLRSMVASLTTTRLDLLRATDSLTLLVAKIGPRPVPYDWSIRCLDANGVGTVFSTFRDAWASPVEFGSCVPVSRSGDVFTAVQLAAIASKAVATEDDLGDLYAMCADVDLDVIAEDTWANASDIAPKGAMTICPDNPKALAVKARFASEEKAAAADRKAASDEAAGIVFGAGVRTVGKDLQPGVYIAVNVSNCYWERLDSAGEIHDNNFIMGAPRVEVTVRSSDYAFNSTGCGQWRRQ